MTKKKVTTKKSEKVKLLLIALTDTSFLSKEDNKLNLIGVFDVFWVAKVPTTWPRMRLVGVLKGGQNKAVQIEVKISNPKKTVLEQSVPIRLGNNSKANMIITLNNFPLEVLGVYKIEIFSSGELLGEYEFRVLKREINAPDKEKNLVIN